MKRGSGNGRRNYRFYSILKGGKKGKRGQTKAIRVGSRSPGATKIGSIRHPF